MLSFRRIATAIRMLSVTVMTAASLSFAAEHVVAAELNYPVILHTRYEAVDPRIGGNFVIWLEREKVWHGLDQHLYPSVKYVDVTHVTASPGSTPITMIEITAINSTIPEFYHLAGIVRFKVTGMIVKSSNLPQ